MASRGPSVIRVQPVIACGRLPGGMEQPLWTGPGHWDKESYRILAGQKLLIPAGNRQRKMVYLCEP